MSVFLSFRRYLWMALVTAVSIVTLCCSFLMIGPDEFLNGSFGLEKRIVCHYSLIQAHLRPASPNICHEAWVERTELQWKPAYYYSYGRGLSTTACSLLVTILMVVVVIAFTLQPSEPPFDDRMLVKRLIKVASFASILTTVIYLLGTAAVVFWCIMTVFFSLGTSVKWGSIAALVYLIPVRENWKTLKRILMVVLATLTQAPSLNAAISGGLACVQVVLTGPDFFKRNGMYMIKEFAGLFYSVVTWYLIAVVGLPTMMPDRVPLSPSSGQRAGLRPKSIQE